MPKHHYNSRATAAMNAAGGRGLGLKEFAKDLPSRLKAEGKSLIGMKPTRREFKRYPEIRSRTIAKYGRDPKKMVSDPEGTPRFRGEANDPRYRRDLKK